MTIQQKTKSEPLTLKEIIESFVIILEDMSPVMQKFIIQQVEKRLLKS